MREKLVVLTDKKVVPGRELPIECITSGLFLVSTQNFFPKLVCWNFREREQFNLQNKWIPIKLSDIRMCSVVPDCRRMRKLPRMSSTRRMALPDRTRTCRRDLLIAGWPNQRRCIIINIRSSKLSQWRGNVRFAFEREISPFRGSLLLWD